MENKKTKWDKFHDIFWMIAIILIIVTGFLNAYILARGFNLIWGDKYGIGYQEKNYEFR